MIHVSVVVHDDGRVDLEGPELELTMWNHDPDRLRDAVGPGRAVAVPYGTAIPRAGGARALRLSVLLGGVGRADAVPSECATGPRGVDL